MLSQLKAAYIIILSYFAGKTNKGAVKIADKYWGQVLLKRLTPQYILCIK